MIETGLTNIEDMPLVCICIPTYNAADTVRETVLSILGQTYKNIVIKISDNASTDATLAIVASINDPRINVHRNLENIGGEGNFNRCIALASGKYTAIFHADDIYEPEIVALQVSCMEADNTIGAVFTEGSLIDENGNGIGAIHVPKDLRRQQQPFDFFVIFKAVLRNSNFLICPSVMSRTSIYKDDIECWRGDLFRSSADLDVWLRIAQKHTLAILLSPLIRYRISNSQVSAIVRAQTDRTDFFKVTDHYLGQSDVLNGLSTTDLRNLQRLERRDQVMRAVNCFMAGRNLETMALLKNMINVDTFFSALQSKRGAGVLFAALSLRIILFTRLNHTGRAIFGYLKRVAKK
jgi:glycosyltransferase involved in cell wall biosynthesis